MSKRPAAGKPTADDGVAWWNNLSEDQRRDRADALVWALSELMVEHNGFDHAMAVMTALYGTPQQSTGDPLIDRGMWKPKQDDGARIKLRAPAGISTVFGAHTGRRYLADTDGIVEMSIEDADAVKSWEKVLTDA